MGAGTALAQTVPPIEAYGELPNMRSMAISPDGVHIAFLLAEGEDEKLIVYKLGVGPVGGAETHRLKARSVYFYDNDHVILRASKTVNSWAIRNRYEHSAAFSYNFADRRIRQLLSEEDSLVFAQSGLGRIIGSHIEDNTVLMPAFTGSGAHPPYSLLRVNLDSERGRRMELGSHDTIDWFVTPDGTRRVREELDNRDDVYRILTKTSNSWETFYEATDQSSAPFSLVGFNPDHDAMIIVEEKADGFSALHELSFDGIISAPVMGQDGKEISGLIMDNNRTINGVRYAGLQPTYEMLDPAMTAVMERVQQRFPASSVYIRSTTDDWSKAIIYVTGGETAGAYFLLDTADGTVSKLGAARNAIPDSSVANIDTIDYTARDGLPLNGILTWPLGNDVDRANLPMIVMPHGGPASHDTIGFDWLAQYFASRGYLIFQPNFRGSTGFGEAFQDAGDGEWGGKMQNDITDGVQGLIDAGLANPDRICIVGASYGGYAALAGGAFTPDLYKCVAAIAGVSDLPQMLIDERKEHDSDHWVVEYWERIIGDPSEQREKLRAISPAYNADAFQAPVLLIHGKDDSVVRLRQSTRMRDALRHAGVPVRLIKLNGEDHWLSTSETRLKTLEALDAFITDHLGAP